MMPQLDLAEEFAAAGIGDLETVGHIRRTHISMSFARMMRYAKAAAG